MKKFMSPLAVMALALLSTAASCSNPKPAASTATMDFPITVINATGVPGCVGFNVGFGNTDIFNGQTLTPVIARGNPPSVLRYYGTSMVMHGVNIWQGCCVTFMIGQNGDLIADVQ